MSRTLVVIGAFAVAVLVALPQIAWSKSAVEQAQAQLTTAIFHAGELAQRGTVLTGARTHTQHVINCLEGTGGPDFVAAAGHVCQGQGNGIINDLTAAQAAGARGADRALVRARAALTVALQGVKFDDVNAVQPFAKVVADNLTAALNAIK